MRAATSDASSCSVFWVWCWNGHWKSGLQKYSTLVFLFLACAPTLMYFQWKKKVFMDSWHTCMQVQCVLYCMVYSPGFHGTSGHEKNCGVAIDEPPRGPSNEPVGRSWNRAFCYGLPVLYKLFWVLLIVNDSTPVFTYYSTIICSNHRVLSEILIVIATCLGSSCSCIVWCRRLLNTEGRNL